MPVASFNYTVWAARYPELAPKVTEPLATAYFGEACIYLDNSDTSLVEDVNVRGSLLNMLVAHIAAINGATAQGKQGLVGRIASVTEGTVTITSEFNSQPGSEQWYVQTKYGAQYWAATAPYRTMQYVPGPAPASELARLGPWGARRWPV